MEWVIFGIVIVWLAIISWFDLRKGEIPHSLWVIIPLILAGIYRVWQGGWQFVVLAVIVALVSERERITGWVHLAEARHTITWLPLILLALYWSVQITPIIALSILGFWIAWELGWWGGADAVCAITLSFIWPGQEFFLTFFGCHAVVTFGLVIFTYKQDRKLKLHRLPGLPIMLLAVLCMPIIQSFLNS